MLVSYSITIQRHNPEDFDFETSPPQRPDLQETLGELMNWIRIDF
jgi:hypothetical protein